EELKLIVSELNSKLEQQAPPKTDRSTKSRVKKLSKAAKKSEKYIPENYVGDAGYGSEENYI
ncbi:MAG: hypothetical protein ACLFT6_01340, partial [Bacteroidales bacterium]